MIWSFLKLLITDYLMFNMWQFLVIELADIFQDFLVEKLLEM